MTGSLLSQARLSILLDVRHPLAALALQPALAMAHEMNVAVNWLPVVAPPLKQPSVPKADDDRGIRHRRSRAQAIAREIDTYAAIQGMELNGYYRSPDPVALNAGWLWVRTQHPDKLEAFLVEAFGRYWGQVLDPSSEPEVASLVDASDLDGSEFRAWSAAEGAARTAALSQELHEQGLSRAPSYLVDGEVFVGRQHLPMIRWILAGRSGPVPI
jgi:2-hydroxychromene-2-carboxylate isomerase